MSLKYNEVFNALAGIYLIDVMGYYYFPLETLIDFIWNPFNVFLCKYTTALSLK